MIKLENLTLPSQEQMSFIIEGMRNPMNSWNKSDTFEKREDLAFTVGPQDFALMNKLANAGTDHRKFMRMMSVMVRITAPLYWWKEFDTYKIGTVANSCSTMHKIADHPFTLDDFSCEHLMDKSLVALRSTINCLNSFRDYYVYYDSYADIPPKKEIWWQMIQLLPSSYNQTRNVTMNYEVLANIYKSRKNHKLDEWVEFCKWIEDDIPYSELIVGSK